MCWTLESSAAELSQANMLGMGVGAWDVSVVRHELS